MHAAQQAARELRRSLSRGLFRPGTRLTEAACAADLGISRNTLREAFAMLEAEGLLERLPHRGVAVAVPTAESVRDLYQARMLIEPAALRWGHNPQPDRLLSITAAARRAAADLRIDAVAAHNQNFHRAIVAGAESTILNETMDRLLARMRLAFLKASAVEPDFHVRFVADNEDVAALLAAGQRDQAAERLHRALAVTSGDVEKLLDA
ncbi:GntR family transcriptional regulator [Corynebacterium uberis]|uniref:GntR family transcriptional regulator n=1 Tax=Corynebacterium TaxID=1716 RepID=UPI001D09A76F|nr:MULTISPECIES: GntR family transcriptional regulator [Corynebacterium]MCZ9308817.1 GntR family transcriptional regulator [Corynebacterium sp. c6VSa_13]UDL72656.1 GntR family transcriptional regulator [Corynebacterium uberis]UDL76468.1 GntR family transcriptional regulator [Corynebacterium uberis]UDL78680.1 GntR family transcriptional regulator [Corynebacterium uberis]UDL80959.1 GntR family transcriptional regulator [Corynebacterium uberis]